MEFKEFKELINKIDVPDDAEVGIVGETGGTYRNNTYFEEDVEKLVMVSGEFQLMSKYHFETEVTRYYPKVTDLNP